MDGRITREWRRGISLFSCWKRYPWVNRRLSGLLVIFECKGGGKVILFVQTTVSIHCRFVLWHCLFASDETTLTGLGDGWGSDPPSPSNPCESLLLESASSHLQVCILLFLFHKTFQKTNKHCDHQFFKKKSSIHVRNSGLSISSNLSLKLRWDSS